MFVLAVITAGVMVVGSLTVREANAPGYPRWETIFAGTLVLLIAVAVGGLFFTSHVTLGAAAAWVVFVAAVATYGRPGLWQVSTGAFLIGALVMSLFGLHIPGVINTVLGLVPGAKQVVAAIIVVIAVAVVAFVIVAWRDTWQNWQETDMPIADEDVEHRWFGRAALRFHRRRHVALAAVGGTFLVVQGFLMVYGYYAVDRGATYSYQGGDAFSSIHRHGVADGGRGVLQLWHIVLLLAVGLVVALEAHLSSLARDKEATEQEDGIRWDPVGPSGPP